MKAAANPMPFWTPSEWLNTLDKYRREVLPNDAAPVFKSLRHRSQRLLLQTWHGATFGHAYCPMLNSVCDREF